MTANYVVDISLNNAIADAQTIDLNQRSGVSPSDMQIQKFRINILKANSLIASNVINLNNLSNINLGTAPVTLTGPGGVGLLSSVFTIDNIGTQPPIMNIIAVNDSGSPTAPYMNVAEFNNYVSLIAQLKLVSATNPDVGLAQTAYTIAFLTGALTNDAVVKQTGVTSDPFPIIQRVAATTDTGILGLAICSAFCDLTSVGSLTSWWIIATEGPVFIAKTTVDLTAGVVGQPVYYTGTGTLTLTAAGNIKLGNILAVNTATGVVINVNSALFQ